MSDARTERERFEEEHQVGRERMAGAANTPPFDDEDAEQRREGRPPSHREGELEHADEVERMEGIAPATGSTRSGELRQPSEPIRDRAADALDQAGDTLAYQADSAAEGLEGAADRVRDTAEYLAESAEDAADYIRDADVDDLRALVERQVRDRPLQTILLAAATGWLVGKILR